MKKVLSILLCAVMLAASVIAAVPGSAILSDYNPISSAPADLTGATGTADSYMGAVKITPDTAGTAVSFTVPGAGEGGTYLVAMLPASYGVSSLEITVNGGSAAVMSAGHKFAAISLGSTDDATVGFTCDADISIYVYGTCSEARTGEMLEAANGSLNKYDEDYLNLDTYDVDRYTEYFWEGDLIFNESFFPVEEKDGTVAPIELNYGIDRVVSVKNSYLDKEYIYGVDYTVENGKLILLPGGSMKIYKYDSVYSDSKIDASWRQTLDGNYAFCGQQPMYFYGYCNITYTTGDTWEGAVPEQKGFLLDNILTKLESGSGTVKLLSIGDSLAGGANASGDLGAKPYAEVWCDMIASALGRRYPDVTVESNTIAQGGADASLCITKMNEILAYAPDLLFIEFGTNECMQGDDPLASGGYVDTLTQAIAAVNEALPECDIVLVAPLITNPIFFPSDWFYAYADSLYTLERSGVAIADCTSIYQYMLTHKRYIDMTGDFLCHPSDFGSRVIVQTLLRTLERGSEAEYISGLSQRILKYRYENEYYETQWQELTALAAEGEAEIAACTDAASARSAYISNIARLGGVQSIADIIEATAVDCSKLVFNMSKLLDLVSGTLSLNVKYDGSEPALVTTLTGRRMPYVLLDYTKGDGTVNAEDYGYAVITLKHPTSNKTGSTDVKLAFGINGTETAAEAAPIVQSDEYRSYIIDLTDKSGWSGQVTSLKITPFASPSNDDVMYISSVVLCADETEALDTAVERARIANKYSDSVATALIADSDDAALLTVPGNSTVLLGDADANGALNAKDILLVRRTLVGMSVAKPLNTDAADMDNDGEITPADCLLLRKTLAGVIGEDSRDITFATVSFSDKMQAAEIVTERDGAAVSYDLSAQNISADDFKYVSLCAKTGDGSAVAVTVTLTSEDGSVTDTLTISSGGQFYADTARFTSLGGKLTSVTFKFDVPAGSTVYFDSFVLSPTITAARNAETVRVGAANLI